MAGGTRAARLWGQEAEAGDSQVLGWPPCPCGCSVEPFWPCLVGHSKPRAQWAGLCIPRALDRLGLAPQDNRLSSESLGDPVGHGRVSEITGAMLSDGDSPQ